MKAVLVQNQALAWSMAKDVLKERGAKGHYFLLGFRPEAVFVREEALQSHVYVVGPSNSGKSSRVLAPLLAQLIDAGKSVVVVDCKGDALLLGHLRETARASGKDFKFFSLQPGLQSGVALDFFSALNGRTPRQVAELLAGSLGLSKAEPYFVSQNTGALALAIANAQGKGRLAFRSIAHELRGILESKEQRFPHAVQALDAMEQLAAVPELNPGKGPSIAIEDLLTKGALLYCCLPVATETRLTSAVAASLLLKLTAMVSRDLGIQGANPRRVFFCIDEFQDVAGSGDLKELVAQVRGIGGGVSLILAHQVQEQLEDEGLRALLQSAGVLVLLAPRAFAKQLQEWSGEKRVFMRGMTEGFQGGAQPRTSRSLSLQETIRPNLEMTLIQELNAAAGHGIVVVGGGAPQPCFFPHHVERDVAARREREAFSGLRALPNQPEAAPPKNLAMKAEPVTEPQAAPPPSTRTLPAAVTLPVRRGAEERMRELFRDLESKVLMRRP
jgi:hypothetical protein